MLFPLYDEITHIVPRLPDPSADVIPVLPVDPVVVRPVDAGPANQKPMLVISSIFISGIALVALVMDFASGDNKRLKDKDMDRVPDADGKQIEMTVSRPRNSSGVSTTSLLEDGEVAAKKEKGFFRS